jgi:cytochrome c-type biogenesis protein CcmH
MGQGKTLPEGGSSKAGWVLLGAALLLAAGSIGFNIYQGAGGSGEAAPATGGDGGIEALRAAAEASTDDAGPWGDLAFAYFNQGQYDEAAAAYRRAVQIAPGEAVLWSALGETLVLASKRDPLPPEALQAFEKALSLDPEDPRGRYFLAAKKDLDKDHEGAIAACVWAMVLGLAWYRTLSWKRFVKVCLDTDNPTRAGPSPPQVDTTAPRVAARLIGA